MEVGRSSYWSRRSIFELLVSTGNLHHSFMLFRIGRFRYCSNRYFKLNNRLRWVILRLIGVVKLIDYFLRSNFNIICRFSMSL